jgi:hypothetical protein
LAGQTGGSGGQGQADAAATEPLRPRRGQGHRQRLDGGRAGG